MIRHALCYLNGLRDGGLGSLCRDELGSWPPGVGAGTDGPWQRAGYHSTEETEKSILIIPRYYSCLQSESRPPCRRGHLLRLVLSSKCQPRQTYEAEDSIKHRPLREEHALNYNNKLGEERALAPGTVSARGLCSSPACRSDRCACTVPTCLVRDPVFGQASWRPATKLLLPSLKFLVHHFPSTTST